MKNKITKFGYLDLIEEEVILPNGEIHETRYIKHPGAVAIIAIKDNKLVCINQYRYPLKDKLIEIPAGKIDLNEDIIEGAKRELIEETGYTFNEAEIVHKMYPAPGFCDELIYFVLAKDVYEYNGSEEYKMDIDEQIEVELLSIEELDILFKEGKLNDLKTSFAYLYLLKESCD